VKNAKSTDKYSFIILTGIVAILLILTEATIVLLKYQGIISEYNIVSYIFPFSFFIFGIGFTYFMKQIPSNKITRIDAIKFITICAFAPVSRYFSEIFLRLLPLKTLFFKGSLIQLAFCQITMGIIILFATWKFLYLKILFIKLLVTVSLTTITWLIVVNLISYTFKNTYLLFLIGDGIWFFFLTIILAYEVGNTFIDKQKNFFKEDNLKGYYSKWRYSQRTIEIIALAPFILFFCIVSVDSIINYDGNCYGFSDGKYECSLLKRISDDLFLGFLFIGIPSLFWALIVFLLLGRKGQIVDKMSTVKSNLK
jgi:hypothetical protein